MANERVPGPPVTPLPAAPAPSAATPRVVYNKATGEAVECAYAIDARELVASGEYQVDPPSKDEKKAAAAEAAEAANAEEAAAAVAPPPAVPVVAGIGEPLTVAQTAESTTPKKSPSRKGRPKKTS